MYQARYARSKNKHSCGFDVTECSDPDFAFFVQRHVCYADMQLKAEEWRYGQRYGGKFHDGSFRKWSDTQSEQFPYAHDDGVTLFLSRTDLEPDATWHLPPVGGGGRWTTPTKQGGDPA